MKSECAGDSILMFLIGFAVGAGAALLMAPQSGRRTRRDLVRRAEEVQDYLEDLGEDLIHRGRDLVERARSGVEQRLKSAAS